MMSQPDQKTVTIHILPKSHKVLRQPDNEIWSGNRIQKEKYFSLKIMQKIRQGDWTQRLF